MYIHTHIVYVVLQVMCTLEQMNMVGKAMRANFNIAVLPKHWYVLSSPLKAVCKARHRTTMVYGFIGYNNTLADPYACVPLYGNDRERSHRPQRMDEVDTFPRVTPSTSINPKVS